MQVVGLEETQAALARLPASAADRINEAARDLARLLATRMQTAGRQEGGQAALVAESVKPIITGRAPAVQIGGARPRGRGGGTAAMLLFGSEFGAGGQGGAGEGSRNFRPWGFGPRAAEGKWVYPTIERSAAQIGEAYAAAADQIVRDFEKGA